jgi:hypothetical protein
MAQLLAIELAKNRVQGIYGFTEDLRQYIMGNYF